MRDTGFKINDTKAKERFAKLLASVDSSNFEPELREYLRRSLKTAMQNTPTRSLSLIQSNQREQYRYRTRYIPSVHHEDDPRLIIGDDGQQYLFCGGKWYMPLKWKLPDEVWAQYAPLEAELRRRLETRQSPFIKERAQARYLYRRTWWEIGQSVGMDIDATQGVLIAHSRHNPIKPPPKGYAQLRGGKGQLSFVIYNPLLGIASKYIDFDPAGILEQAASKHRSNFRNALGRKFRELVPKEN
jgi:hypothetical protein